MSTRRSKTPAKLTQAQVSTQLRLAAEAFDRSNFVSGGLKLIEDFQKLDLVMFEEQTECIANVLREIKAEHRTSPGCYRGPHPPTHISGEPRCAGERMLQFVWDSAHLNNRRMYVKFCLSSGRLVLLRIHEDYAPGSFKE